MLLRTAAEKMLRFGTMLRYLKRAFEAVSDALHFIAKWKAVRLIDEEWSLHELDHVPASYHYKGLPPSAFALKDHEHPEYVKKDETVEEAQAIHINGKDYKPSELAPKHHEHSEYVKRDELVVEAKALGGVPAEEFALKDHEHPEYIKRDEVVDIAYIIDGYVASDFAPYYHDHGMEYYRKTDTVLDAWELVDDEGNIYTWRDFAPADHTHEEYLTREEAEKLFLRKDEPYHAAKQIAAEVVTVRPTGEVLDVGTTNYALLQMPHTMDAEKSEVMVNTTKIDSRETFVEVFGTELFTCPGRWLECALPVQKKILAVIVTPVAGVNTKLRHLTHFVAWNGNRFRIYQYDYPDVYTMKVRVLIFAE